VGSIARQCRHSVFSVIRYQPVNPLHPDYPDLALRHHNPRSGCLSFPRHRDAGKYTCTSHRCKNLAAHTYIRLERWRRVRRLPPPSPCVRALPGTASGTNKGTALHGESTVRNVDAYPDLWHVARYPACMYAGYSPSSTLSSTLSATSLLSKKAQQGARDVQRSNLHSARKYV
jgi:hypothetical protein